jgi:hypothetical protein
MKAKRVAYRLGTKHRHSSPLYWALYSQQEMKGTALEMLSAFNQPVDIVINQSTHESVSKATSISINERLCALVVRVPGYTTEMYCASCEERTEFIYAM